MQRRYDVKKTVSKISDLPFHLAQEIMLSYYDRYYCHDCFAKQIIVNMKRKDNISRCPNCGKIEYLDDETYFTNKMSKKWTGSWQK